MKYGCQPKNRGKNPKWMVTIMVPNSIKIDDLGRFSHIFGKHPNSDVN